MRYILGQKGSRVKVPVGLKVCISDNESGNGLSHRSNYHFDPDIVKFDVTNSTVHIYNYNSACEREE